MDAVVIIIQMCLRPGAAVISDVLVSCGYMRTETAESTVLRYFMTHYYT